MFVCVLAINLENIFEYNDWETWEASASLSQMEQAKKDLAVLER